MRRYALLVLLCVVGTARAQQIFTYRTETHLIDTTISVRDAQGGLVQGLTQNDFRIVEDGVPQTVKFFAHDRELPLSVGIILDESGSQEKFIKAHERDLEQFLQEVLEPKDEAFAVCFGNHLRLVSDVTHSPQGVVSGVRAFDKGSTDFPEIGPQEKRDLGTALFDAVYFSVHDKMQGKTGRRKVLLLMTDGEENSSEHDLIDAIQAAQESNVLVYALRYTDMHHNQVSARDRYGMRVLNHLSDQTGGRTFDIKAVAVREAFADIAGELRSLYDIAYQSTNHVRDGKFRKVEIMPVRPDLVVRSRAGYYAGNGQEQ